MRICLFQAIEAVAMVDCCEDKACAVEELRSRQSATLKTVFAINAGMFLIEAAAGLLSQP